MRFKYFNLFLVIILFFSCEEIEEYNPMDPINNADFIPPETVLTIENLEGTILDSNSVTITWEGNEMVTEFSYNLDSTGWSEWDTSSTVTLEYLDEGDRMFRVKGRYPSESEDDTPAQVQFTVDALEGPRLRVFPLMSSTDLIEVSYIDIFVEEVDSLALAEFDVIYNQHLINIASIGNGSLLSDYDSLSVATSLLISENNDGAISINFSILGDSGLSGSGSIVRFKLIGKTPGSFTMQIINPVFRDVNNNDIPFLPSVNGQVVVE